MVADKSPETNGHHFSSLLHQENNNRPDNNYRRKVKKCCRDIFSIETVKTKLPILKWLPKYSLTDLQCDVIAGLTVGLTVMPQGLAYAKVAGLPPQYGLYSAFMGCFVYTFLGTSKDITLGPTAIMSLMTATFSASPVPNDPTYAIILTLISGCVQLVMGLLNLGIVVNFISYPIINAFTSAAAITIAFSQVKHILGLKNIPREFLHMVYEIFAHIGETRIWDMTLGLSCLVLLFIIKKGRTIKWKDERPEDVPMYKKIGRKALWLFSTAANAVIVISAAGVTAGLISLGYTDVLTITGELKAGLPPFKVPDFTLQSGNITQSTGEIFTNIGAGFGIVPLLALIEAVAIGKAFARQNNYRIRPTQELIAIGIANIVSSFCSSYPITGSFSRTAVNSQSGVRTPASGIVTGCLVLLALYVLTPLFYYIPNAALAAVIISAVIQMVDFKILKILWRANKLDLGLLVITFICSLVIGMEYGILVGVGLSIIVLLYPTARPGIKYTVTRENLLVVQPDQGMRFPAAEYVVEEIIERATMASPNLSVIFDFQHISSIDYTSVLSIKELMADLVRFQLQVVLTNVNHSVLEDLDKANIPSLKVFSDIAKASHEIFLKEDIELTVHL